METKYDYKFFLFSQLAIDNYLTQKEDMDYDHMFDVLIELYEDFLISEFNTHKQSYDETMSQYVANLIG
jgi:hypothetical protein